MATSVDRRRRWLLAAGVGGVAAVLATGSTQHGRAATWLSKQWVERIVRDHLPGALLDAPSLRAFAVDMVHGHPELRSSGMQARVSWRELRSMLGAPGVEEPWEQLERAVITRFLTGSNFFRLSDPGTELVVFDGAPGACGNPFARFRET